MSFSDEEDFDDIYGDDNKQGTTTVTDTNNTGVDEQRAKDASTVDEQGSAQKEEPLTGGTGEAAASGTVPNASSSLDQLAALQVLSSNLNQLQQQSTSNNSNNNTTTSSDNANNDSNKGVVHDQLLAQGMPDLSQLQQLQQTMSQLQQQAAPLTPQESKQVKADLSRDINKMFIGGLNWETTEDNLREYFSKYGNVTEVKIMRDGTTGRSRGFGFLSFAEASSVDEVVKTQHILDGKVIDPKRAIPREEQDKTGKIFVGGIGPDVRPKEFEEFFSQWGSIIDAQLMLDKDTGRSRGFGFITYDSPDAVDRVCQNKFTEFKGKRIEIKRAEPRQVQKQRTTNPSPTSQTASFANGQTPQPQQQFQMMSNPMMANPMFNPQAMADYYAKMQEYYQQSGIDYSQMYQQQMQQMQQMMSMMSGGGAGAGTGSMPVSGAAGATGDDTNGVPTIGEDSSSSSSGKDNNDKESSNSRHDSYGNRDRERSPDTRRGHRNYNDREEGHGFRRENRDRGFRGRERRGGGYGRDRRGFHPYSR